jgi:hypothetical protein
MQGNYLERSVDTKTFEFFKQLGKKLDATGGQCNVHGMAMEIEEPLVFSLYEALVHEQKAQSGSGDILPMLREIVDTIYSGPPIDYIVLNSE